jgi:hypothetical protein
VEISVKIKIVGRSKNIGAVGRTLSRTNVRVLRPYNMRVKREHGGGLWTIEDDRGQLYLAVLSREVSDAARENLHETTVRAGRT